MDLKHRHASLKCKTFDGDVIMVCTCCGARYDRLNNDDFAKVQESGKCYFCGAILDGEENDHELLHVYDYGPLIPLISPEEYHQGDWSVVEPHATSAEHGDVTIVISGDHMQYAAVVEGSGSWGF